VRLCLTLCPLDYPLFAVYVTCSCQTDDESLGMQVDNCVQIRVGEASHSICPRLMLQHSVCKNLGT
jgi:hypothetical protein